MQKDSKGGTSTTQLSVGNTLILQFPLSDMWQNKRRKL